MRSPRSLMRTAVHKPRQLQSPSFDDPCGPGPQRRRDLEAKLFGRSQIDDEIVLARLHDREIAGAGSLQDPVDVFGHAGGKPPERLAIRHQSARVRIAAEVGHGGESSAHGEGRNPRAGRTEGVSTVNMYSVDASVDGR